MSTTIYDAYKLRADASVFELRRELLAEVMPQLRIGAWRNLLANTVYAYDLQVALGQYPDFATLLAEDINREQQGVDNPLANTYVVVVENPVRDERYCICRGALQDMTAQLLALPSITESYEYWDNTDAPDDISEAAWADRRQAWDEALPAQDSIGVQGVTITLLSEYGRSLTYERIVDYREQLTLPDDNARVERLAQALYLQGERGSHQVNVANLMGRYSAWLDNAVEPEERAHYLAEARAAVQPLDLTALLAR